MHRVELKGNRLVLEGLYCPSVPNAPCGVESSCIFSDPLHAAVFLMHRVKLKELPGLEDRTGFNAACS